MIFTSLDEVVAATAQYMIQPLAILVLILVLFLYRHSKKRLQGSAWGFLSGIGLAYALQSSIFYSAPQPPAFIYVQLVLLSAIAVVMVGLTLVQLYVSRRNTALKPEIVGFFRRLRDLPRKNIPIWSLVLLGLGIGFIEPLFYGQTQQLLVAEIQTNLGFLSLLTLLLGVALALLPLVVLLLAARFATYMLNKDQPSQRQSQALILLLGFLLVVTPWLMLLYAHNFI